MAVLPVRLYGDPALRRQASPVTEFTSTLTALIDDLIETMYDSVGIGLAAPQVGIGLRLLVLDTGEGTPRALVNPVVVEQGGREVGEEGCLSLPGIFADVERAERVVITSQDPAGVRQREEARGLLARVLQHEIDHLDGILFIDRLDKVTRDRIKRRIKREGFPEETARSAFAL
jgi:peptide deformylase